jgi:hypothetical protein
MFPSCNTAADGKSFKKMSDMIIFEAFRAKRVKVENNKMKKSHLFMTAMLLLAGLFFTAGCVNRERMADQSQADQSQVQVSQAGTEVVVDKAPPLPEVETMTIAPGPGFVWVPGAWSWRGDWIWDHGHWAHPPQPGAVWVAPRYEVRDGKQIFIRGGWKY